MISCFTKWNKVLSLHLFFCCFINFGYKMGFGSKPALSLKHVLNVQIRCLQSVCGWMGSRWKLHAIFVIIRWLTVYVSRNSKICCCLHAQKFTLTSRISLYRRQPVEFSLLLQIMPHATWVMLTHQTQSKVVSASICMQKLPEREKESVQWPDNHDLLWFGFFS